MYREELAVSGSEPVSLAEAKAHARIEVSFDDSLVTALIVAARKWAEDWTQRRYVDHQFKLTLNANELCNPLKIEPINEIATVSGFDAFDPDNTTTVALIEGTDFRIQNNTLILEPSAGDALVREFGAYEITYTTATNAVDIQNVRQAIMLVVTHWYENREENSIDTDIKQLPTGAKSCLGSEKRYTF